MFKDMSSRTILKWPCRGVYSIFYRCSRCKKIELQKCQESAWHRVILEFEVNITTHECSHVGRHAIPLPDLYADFVEQFGLRNVSADCVWEYPHGVQEMHHHDSRRPDPKVHKMSFWHCLFLQKGGGFRVVGERLIQSWMTNKKRHH